MLVRTVVADWLAWATERVAVRPPDPAWQQCGERVRQLLESVLGRCHGAGLIALALLDRGGYCRPPPGRKGEGTCGWLERS